MKTALIFPGQGAQYAGMGKDFFDSFLIARETFQEADDLLNEKLSQIVFEGPEEVLTETRYSQMAIFVTSMAILRTLRQQIPGVIPWVCAGFSLGEYTALCASGRLSFRETLFLVRERARLMNEACLRMPGTMAAVLGLSADDVAGAVKGLKGVWVANFNAPGQTVISGTKEGIERATFVLKERGAKRVLPLTVHGAFHSGLMQSAQEGLTPFIEGVRFEESEVAFVMNVTGAFAQNDAEIRDNLIRQVTQSVRWEQGIEAMKAAGVEMFLEIGCGKTLTGLNRKMGISAALSMDRIADLEQEAMHAIT